MSRTRSLGYLTGVAVVALLLAACGLVEGDGDDDAGGSSAPGELHISNVTMTRAVSDEFEPLDTTFTFAPDAGEIWAVVLLENVTRAVTVTGSWSYLGPLGQADASLLAEASVEVAPIENPRRRSGLRLAKEPFDAGVYQLSVLLDGDLARTVQFSVAEGGAEAPGGQPQGQDAQTPQATAPPVEPTQPPPEPTQPPVEPAQPPGEQSPPLAVDGVYTVQPGDSLAVIAQANGTTVEAIMQANGLPDTNIFAGQQLTIPAPGQ